jgi:hypothetical protein
MTNKKLSILLIALVLMISVTGLTFAYWDKLSDSDDIDIALGESIVLSLEAGSNTADGKTLVPAGAMMGTNDTDNVVFNYTVNLSKTPAEAANLHVAVVPGSVKIGGSDVYASLVNIAINAPSTISTHADFTVTVTLTEPEDQTAYDAVAGKNVTFEIRVLAD